MYDIMTVTNKDRVVKVIKMMKDLNYVRIYDSVAVEKKKVITC